MKKLILGIIATGLLATNINAQNITDLNKDKDFIQLIKEMDKFVDIEPQDDLVAIIFADRQLTENELTTFYKIFGTDQTKFKSQMVSHRTLITRLDTKFGLLDPNSQDELIVEIGEVIGQEAAKSNCRKRLENARLRNLAYAVLGHGACLAADLTVVAGIVCHAAVGTLHHTYNREAWFDYLDCLDGTK